MKVIKISSKNIAQVLSKAILVLLGAAAVTIYFSSVIPLSIFNSVAVVVSVIAWLSVYLGWLSLRTGVLFVAIVAVLMVGAMFSTHNTVKAGYYQAVFLTNDQIYLGHIINQNQEEIILSE